MICTGPRSLKDPLGPSTKHLTGRKRPRSSLAALQFGLV